MNSKDYGKIRDASMERRKALGAKKRADYATEDVLSNFKRLGEAARVLRIDALLKLHPALGYSTFMEIMKIDRRINVILNGNNPQNELMTDTFDDQKNYTDLSEAIYLELSGLVEQGKRVQKRNRNYINGRAKEYRVKHAKERDGFVVIRASGSHGLFDLVAIRAPGKRGTNSDHEGRGDGLIQLIQCKSGKSQERELKKLRDSGIIEIYGGMYKVEVLLV